MSTVRRWPECQARSGWLFRPLAGGLLPGKFGRDRGTSDGARRAGLPFPPVDEDRAFDRIDAIPRIAAAHGVSVAQVALGWLLRQGHVTSMIIGARRVEQLDDTIAATRRARCRPYVPAGCSTSSSTAGALRAGR